LPCELFAPLRFLSFFFPPFLPSLLPSCLSAFLPCEFFAPLCFLASLFTSDLQPFVAAELSAFLAPFVAAFAAAEFLALFATASLGRGDRGGDLLSRSLLGVPFCGSDRQIPLGLGRGDGLVDGGLDLAGGRQESRKLVGVVRRASCVRTTVEAG
jgi:hypothetical protein